MAHAGAGKMTRVRERKQLPEQNCSNAESVESSELIIVAVRLSGVAHDAHDVSCLSDERVRFRTVKYTPFTLFNNKIP